ncbi:phosphoethanolamine--lipid A transferase [Acidovorax lacteus]
MLTSSASSSPAVAASARVAPTWRERMLAAWRAPRSPQAIVFILVLWFTVTANWALWMRLGHVDGHNGSPWVLRAQFLLLVVPALTMVLSLTAWPRGMKPVWALLLVVAAATQHFMLAYGTVVDPGMVRNVLQTHASESADLLHPLLLLHLAVVVVVPLVWLWQVPVQRAGALRSLWRTTAMAVAAALVLVGSVFAMYRDLAPVVRNNMALRFMLNPASPVLSTLDVVVKPLFKRPKPFVSIAAGATLGPGLTAAQGAERVPLLVLVVGETARSDHFGLNGYERDTTPELARRGVLSWTNVRSCGTSTLESVPCMFSHLGRSGYLKRVAQYDNLLDVLQTAGLAVLWLDNQAGCKGVCERVPSASTDDAQKTPAGQALCTDGECLDLLMLEGLDERIARLPEDARARGVVLVLHQMGSHGPAYHRRSAPERKVFEPECRTHALADCPRDQLINVYDNSIRETDHFLGRTLDWIAARKDRYDGGMVYVSDHGESLGEMGLYLHGMPYAVAPDVQKHVPLVAALGPLGARRGIDTACLQAGLGQPLTHDNLYHSVLGLLDVRSPTYQQGLDMFASCRPATQRVAQAS